MKSASDLKMKRKPVSSINLCIALEAPMRLRKGPIGYTSTLIARKRDRPLVGLHRASQRH
jgi:hypothetical protein